MNRISVISAIDPNLFGMCPACPALMTLPTSRCHYSRLCGLDKCVLFNSVQNAAVTVGDETVQQIDEDRKKCRSAQKVRGLDCNNERFYPRKLISATNRSSANVPFGFGLWVTSRWGRFTATTYGLHAEHRFRVHR